MFKTVSLVRSLVSWAHFGTSRRVSSAPAAARWSREAAVRSLEVVVAPLVATEGAEAGSVGEVELRRDCPRTPRCGAPLFSQSMRGRGRCSTR